MGIVHNLIDLEMVEAHQPVGLIQAVLTHQGRLFQNRQAWVVGIHTDISRVIDASHGGLAVEHRRHCENVTISLFCSPHNHLRGLSRRHKSGCMAVFLPVFLVLQDTLLDESHWLEHTLMVFLWSQ